MEWWSDLGYGNWKCVKYQLILGWPIIFKEW